MSSQSVQAALTAYAACPFFEQLANNSLMGVAVVQNKRIVFANTKLAELSGYSQQQLLQLPTIHVLIPTYGQREHSLYQLSQSLHQEDECVHYSGRVLDIDLSLATTTHEGLDAVLLCVLDITEQKKSARDAQVATLVYKNAREAIVFTDENGIVIDVNPAFTAITGYVLADVIGRSMNMLSSGRHDRLFYQNMWEQIRTTGRWQGDIWNKRKNGEEYAERLTVSTCYNEDGSIYGRIGLFFDVTSHKEREESIWRQANYDHLTGLPNRQHFQKRLQQAMFEAEQQSHAFALIFLDLDLFKDVNDTFGHDMGDLLLCEVARRLQACVRENLDTVARLGGDEFTIIVSNVRDERVVTRICEDVLLSISQPYVIQKNTITVSASLGVTFYPEDAKDASELLKNADLAMYAAKECGRNQYCFFLPAMSEAIQARMVFSQDLKTAIVEDQFILYYQPILNMRTQEVVKFEALIRWEHPQLGLVPPSEYIPFAEDSGLIIEVGNWVLDAALKQARIWHLQGYSQSLSINVSPAQFYAEGIDVDHWVKRIHQAGVPTEKIIIEITERLLLENNPVITQLLQRFQQAGVRIALDDFGTGFSSLTYLKRYPIDIIKIDQSFVSHLDSDSEDLALCEAMIVMAQKLGVEVIAEGIEGETQEKMLLQAGCSLGQGYLYSRPVPAVELDQWLAERNRQADNTNNNNEMMTMGLLDQRA